MRELSVIQYRLQLVEWPGPVVVEDFLLAPPMTPSNWRTQSRRYSNTGGTAFREVGALLVVERVRTQEER